MNVRATSLVIMATAVISACSTANETSEQPTATVSSSGEAVSESTNSTVELDPRLLFHTLTAEEGVPTADFEGEFMLDDGCLVFVSGSASYVVALPIPSSLDDDSVILDGEGIPLGDTVSLGGGEVDPGLPALTERPVACGDPGVVLLTTELLE